MSAFSEHQLSLTLLNLSKRMEQILLIQAFLKTVRESAETHSTEEREEWLHLNKRLEDLCFFFNNRYNQHERTVAITERALKAKQEESNTPPADSFEII